MPSPAFLQKAWIKNSTLPRSSTLPVKINPITAAHLQWWQANIDPVIKTLRYAWRADHDWDWDRITFDCLTPFSRITPYHAQAFSLTLPQQTDPQGSEVVVALLKIVRGSTYPLNHQEKAVYLWYCSTAPTDALQQFLHPHGYPDTSLLPIDTAIICAYQDGDLGKIWLHADPKDPNLQTFYQTKCGMARINPALTLPGSRRYLRRNDGRYYYLDSFGAQTFTNQLTLLR